MHKIILPIIILVIGLAANANSNIDKYIKNPEVVGNGNLKFLLMHVYDISLIAKDGRFDQKKPFALEIVYHLEIKGKDIAKRSVEEMKKQGFSDEKKLKNWLILMKNIFPNVKNGSVITGIKTKDNKTIFYSNDSKIGEVKDPEFTKLFFDIWLSEKTSEPKLRNQILGIN
jgi:hypothetical protein